MDPHVAAWAAKTVSLGPGGSVFHALVLGPRQIPRAERGAPAELALLSAIAHGLDEPDAIGLAVASIASLVDRDRAEAHFDLLRYILGDALDRALEALMTAGQQRYLSVAAGDGRPVALRDQTNDRMNSGSGRPITTR